MCLKYVSGAQSFVEAVSFTFFHDRCEWENNSPVDPYYLGILIFGGLSLIFSFGNIENSKTLQVTTSGLRFLAIIFMYGGSIFYLGKYGMNAAPVFDPHEQFKSLATVFGNTVFVFIFHHSISGIIYPIRPQHKTKKMFLASHVVGASLLGIEGLLAFFAFSGLTNDCNTYPCKPQGLFNENFLGIPFIGQFCNFYPMLNVSAVPILTITLRNNLMEVIPIKRWLRKYRCCHVLLDVSDLPSRL